MAIDIHAETLVSMAEAPKALPRRPSTCTLWRWRNRGVGGRKLESVKIGGTVYTSLEALQRFAQQQQPESSPAARSPRQRDRAIAQAERELANAGI